MSCNPFMGVITTHIPHSACL